MSWKRSIALAIIVALCATAYFMREPLMRLAGLGGGSSANTAAKPGAPPAAGAPARAPQPVETAVVTAGQVADEIEAVGTLTANESAAIAPEIAGRITALSFREGQDVKAGQVLVELDSSILSAELRQAEAESELAESTFERTNELVKRGAGTVVAQQQATSQRVAGRVKADLARERLEKSKLLSPFDGVVGLRSISVGAYVNVGQAIITVTSIDPIKVDFRVPEIYLRNVEVGQKIAVTIDARPGQSYEGEIYAIDPVIDENGRAIKLRARVPNKDRQLSPGLFARVKITTGIRQNASLVPESALVSDPTSVTLYVVENGAARLRKVKTGTRLPGKVEVTEGVKPGEIVVTAGQMRLRDGAPVNITKRQAENVK